MKNLPTDPFPSVFYGVISMRSIILFAEDYGHEKVITALVERLSREAGVEVSINARSVRGGYGKVKTEFRSFLDDLNREKDSRPDLLKKNYNDITLKFKEWRR